MAEKKKKTVYEGYSPSDDELRSGVEKANSYDRRERETNAPYTKGAVLKLWIGELIRGLLWGVTAWDVIKCVPRRALKAEDYIPEYGDAELVENRARAEGSISATLSEMEADGVIRWRNEGLLKDEAGNPVEGGEMRMGGYGIMRRVYESVPRSEWEAARQHVMARKATRRAERLFVKEGAAAIRKAEREVEEANRRADKLASDLAIIVQHFGIPEWMGMGEAS